MRKTLLFILALSLTAAWMIGCGSSSKTVITPTTQTSTFAFMEESGSGTYLFSPMIGTYTTTNGTTTFKAAAVVDNSNQPVTAEFYSIYLSTDGKTATLDLYGGLDGTSGEWDIWVAPADGSSNPTQVTNDTNGNRMPQLSPDNTTVVFNSYRIIDEAGDYGWMVITRKTDGTGEQVLPMPPGAGQTWAPTYSPDGSKIAVEAWGYDASDNYFDGIWVMNSADGSNPVMLTNPSASETCDCYDEHPAYTSDGSKIVFSRYSYDTTTEDIYIMNSDGTGVTQLTNDGVADFDPMVIKVAGTSLILFSSNITDPTDTTGASFELYSMNMDGTGVSRLTNNTEYDAFCGDWYEWGEAASSQRSMRHTLHPHHSLAAGHNSGHKVRW